MKKQWIYFLLALIGLSVSSYFMRNKYEIKNLLAIEFASSESVMQEAIEAIPGESSEKFMLLRNNTYWDFIFIIFYSLLGIVSFRIIADEFGAKLSLVIIIVILLPGLLDVVEDIYLLLSASRGKAVFDMLYFWAVHIKWGLSTILLTFIPITILFGLAEAIKTKKMVAA